MLNTDEDALYCDFVETYHIFDYKALPPLTAGRLASGLRDDSRIKMKLSGFKEPLEICLLAAIVDGINILAWQNSRKNSKRPNSVLEVLISEEKESDIVGYNTAEEFEAAWKMATEKA